MNRAVVGQVVNHRDAHVFAGQQLTVTADVLGINDVACTGGDGAVGVGDDQRFA